MEPIAIIGLGCRFPKANNPEAFWQLLRDGVDAIAEVPPDRWNIDAFYSPEPATPGKMNSRWGGFLERVDQFDAAFFEIPPSEAEQMDPQQRLLLEVAWEAIENAGLQPETLAGSSTGVFIGLGNYDYHRSIFKEPQHLGIYSATGAFSSIAANRLSYAFDLRGPSLVIDTACSSSLVALHFACQSLRSGESSLCIVGGVSLVLSPEPNIAYSQSQLLAADGRCKTFDKQADGYVRGEGCGAVILKHLSRALADGDRILAVIRGSAVNQNGLSHGLTAPNGLSQKAVIEKALENAGVEPAQISYVEAHGTGTAIGDAIEMEAIQSVLKQNRSPDRPCWIGSAKTNIGHLDAASGMASVIKVALCLTYREIPPHLHLKQVNRYISLEGTPFAIPTTCQPWDVSENRLAGVSAFSFGGANAHVILEEAPARVPADRERDRPLHVLTLRAKSDAALRALAQSYAAFLSDRPEISLADICFTANTGRANFNRRLAVLGESAERLREQLLAFLANQKTGEWVSGKTKSRKRPKVVFVFTDGEPQYIDMGRQLYDTQPGFRQTLKRCEAILQPYLERSLLSVLYPESGTSSLLEQKAYAQPALFAVEYALAELWRSWGIEPVAVMGHGVGEFVAACVAGAFTLEDGLKLIAQRDLLQQTIGEVTLRSPNIKTVSPVTGELNGEEIATSEYWLNSQLQTVKLAESLENLYRQGYKVFVEISPQPVLEKIDRTCLSEEQGIRLSSLRRTEGDWQQMLLSLGELYIRGCPVSWTGFDRDYSRQRVALPTYPFQRSSYWLKTANARFDRTVASPTSER